MTQNDYATRRESHWAQGCPASLSARADPGHAGCEGGGAEILRHHPRCAQQHRVAEVCSHGQTRLLSRKRIESGNRRTLSTVSRCATGTPKENHGNPAKPCRIRPATGPFFNAKAEP